MLLDMAIGLAFTSIMLEGLLAYRVVSYRHLMQSREWLSVVVSMTLSFFLGKLFGAAGLICLMAGVMSTVASPFMYKSLNWYDINKFEVNKKAAEIKQTFRDFGVLLYKLMRLLTLPFRLIRSGMEQYEAAKVKLHLVHDDEKKAA